MSDLLEAYKVLRGAGFTPASIYAWFGNTAAESGNMAFRLEGDYAYPYTKSTSYVQSVDRGNVTMEEFAQPVGFGLAQWTYPPRKRNLWKFWKSYGGSIGDFMMQTAFAVWEFQTGFPILFAALCECTDVYTATRRICYEYENPAVKNTDERYRLALTIKNQLELEMAGQGKETETDKKPAQPIVRLWPPRTIDKNMSGDDVAVLQSILKARGYYSGKITGKFDDATEEAVEAFQLAKGLVVDGVVGPKTWAKLVELTA